MLTRGWCLEFDFWGTAVQVTGVHRADRDHLGFTFREFRVAGSTSCDWRFRLDVEDRSVGFVDALRRPDLKKRVWCRPRLGDETLYDEFDRHSSRAGFIPPFGMDPLVSRFRLVHAAALTAHDQTLVIRGASGAGKTTLALALLGRGWRLHSDDVAVLDDAGRVHPFPKPMNVRTRVLPLFPALADRVPTVACSMMTDSGLTHMTHANDVGLELASAPTGNIIYVDLERSTRLLALGRISPNQLHLTCDVATMLDETVDLLCTAVLAS